MMRLTTGRLTLLIALLTIMVTPAVAGSPTTRPAGEPSEDLITRIYELKYADPNEVAKVLAGVAGGRYVPLDAKHALLIGASQSRFPEIEALIKALDVPTAERQLRVVKLRYARIDTVVDTLRAAFPKLKIGIDRPTQSLLIDKAWAEPVSELLAQLDQARPAVPEVNYSLRLVWLVNDEKLPPPPSDLQDALEELSVLGVQELRLAAQVMSVAKGKFNVEATPAIFLDCHLKLEGSLVAAPGESPWLDLTLSATAH